MKKLSQSLPFRLVLSVVIDIIIGQIANTPVMNVVVAIKYILNQMIVFCAPSTIIGFITPSITKLGNNASKVPGIAVIIAYVSFLGTALFSVIAGMILIPYLLIVTGTEGLKDLSLIVFQLDIPQIMPITSALVFSLLLSPAATWTKTRVITTISDEFRKIVLDIVTRVIIPILPIFIASTLCAFSYEGTITGQLPVFIQVVIIIVVGHYIWLALLYFIGGAHSGKNPMNVMKNYGPAYVTTIGTVSSAATLAMALRCAKKSGPTLRDNMVDSDTPLFTNIHPCGSVLTGVFFVMTVSKILYGSVPSIRTMVLFHTLLDVFAIGAPSVSSGTVMASLGLITDILGFNEVGTTLMLTIFTLQDSFDTACNVTGDGALTMVLTGFAEEHNIKKQEIKINL